MTKNFTLIIILLASSCLSLFAHEGHGNTFSESFIQSFTGLDHILLAIAVGIAASNFTSNQKIINSIILLLGWFAGVFLIRLTPNFLGEKYLLSVLILCISYFAILKNGLTFKTYLPALFILAVIQGHLHSPYPGNILPATGVLTSLAVLSLCVAKTVASCRINKNKEILSSFSLLLVAIFILAY